MSQLLSDFFFIFISFFLCFYFHDFQLSCLLLRSALEQKKSDESEKYGAIDYDAPVESDPNTIGLGTKVIALR